MKKNLLKKFSACLLTGMAFIITAMMFSASANAQIVYTDVSPDSISGGTYNLDLNNDGTNDFVIIRTTTQINCNGPKTNIYVSVTPLGTNQVACYPGNNATKMVLNETINDSVITWNNSANLFMAARIHNNVCMGITSGQWVNITDGYLGLKLISGSNIYYGWARLKFGGFVTSFTIKDYAYNSIPDSAILAGDTGSGTTGLNENSFASSINLFPNPANNHLTIAFPNTNEKVEVTIADITGKVIYKTIATDTQKLELNTTDFAKGIYVVQIQSADFIGMKKLVLEK